MKKKIIILAAVAVSGLAAVVASKVNVAEAVSEQECLSPVEVKGSTKYCCIACNYSNKCQCYIQGHYTLIYDAEWNSVE